ncbi:glycosyltransferase family 4 protein [Anabaena subtropica]|uniref:Glycosyltransferase family 4 protein n=1 Tax=Anabaena subtropica FACHB-260 TaxID=2692884 RepID=A0ABR8CNN1_9NOST|nr:glycosyltransferase family 4 protein [Anabaena subtropica]MBD2343425.1 glycosyltransferase family 4 protein [Anabaena subtropica FACHB-260]
MKSIKRVLTVIGDPNQINTWSNTPYFFLKAGQKLGFLDAGITLNPDKLRTQRIIWNLLTCLKTAEKGGFQYTDLFLKKLFAQANLNKESIEIISHFPLLPPVTWANSWKVSYYIDATLHQNFAEYGLAKKVNRHVRQAAIEQEKKNYQNAEKVICMCQWAAESVVKNYDISPIKVHVIRNAANVQESNLGHQGNSPILYPPLNPLRLGFIGKDWQRKGLLYLLQIAETLNQRGIAVEVIAAGSEPKTLPCHPLLKSIGFIDKANNMQKFIDLIRSFHFGCLFSSAEASPGSNLECLRLGVPVLSTKIGGIPGTVPDGLGFLFEYQTPPEKVADFLESFTANPSKYYELRQQVAKRSEEFSWQQTVHKFIQVWEGSEEFRYKTLI